MKLDYKRVLTIQDISCLGQCSGTVALPIISVCGHECCILPSSVLSTHTYGFTGYTFADLTDQMPPIRKHWEKENIKFDCVYTGYLGSNEQIEYVSDIMASCLKNGGLKVVDPAMADGGKLYTGFDMEFVACMKSLCAKADIVVPNITEASLITGIEYKETYDEAYVKSLADALLKNGSKCVVLTGIGYREGYTGVVVAKDGRMSYYEHEKISKGCHGTGDVYASAFVGALMNGRSEGEAARIAADFVVECIKGTIDDPDHWYGVKFEPQLGKLAHVFAK